MILRLCLVIVSLCVFTSHIWAQSTKVMSFNILFDGGEGPEEEWDDPEHPRRDRVDAILNEENADLIGFQEIANSQYPDLINMLPEYDNVRNGENGIFFKRDRFNLVDSGRVDYSVGRFLIWAKLFDTSINQTLVMFDTHLFAGLDNSNLRLIQSAEVQTAISNIADDLPAILTGDFNFAPFDSVLSQSTPHFQTITGREETLVESRFLVDTCSNFCGNPSGAGGPRRIDYVNNTDHFEVLNAERIDRLYDGLPPSDHPVITAQLEFTPLGARRRRWSVQNHVVADLDTGGGLNGIADAYLQGTGRPEWPIGSFATGQLPSLGSYPGGAKYVMKFLMPEPNPALPALESATLRIYVKDILGSLPEGLSLMHSTTENDTQPFPRDYKRPYTDTGLDLIVSPGGENQYYEFDVTSFIQDEMTSGDPSLITAFRLELDSALIPATGTDKAYVIDSQDFAPQLVMTFVPEPTTTALALAATLFLVVRRRR